MPRINEIPIKRREQFNQYVDAIISDPSYGYSDGDRAELLDQVVNKYAESDKGKAELANHSHSGRYPVADAATAAAMKALGYLGGITRTGVATAASMTPLGTQQVSREDIAKAFKGNAPSTADFLEKNFNVPEGGRLSDFLPIEPGKPYDVTARGAAGFVGDAAFDPLGNIVKAVRPFAAVKGAERAAQAGAVLDPFTYAATRTRALTPVAAQIDDTGRGVYRSGVRNIDKAFKSKRGFKATDRPFGNLGYDMEVGGFRAGPEEFADQVAAARNTVGDSLNDIYDVQGAGQTVNLSPNAKPGLGPQEAREALELGQPALAADIISGNSPKLAPAMQGLKTKLTQANDKDDAINALDKLIEDLEQGPRDLRGTQALAKSYGNKAFGSVSSNPGNPGKYGVTPGTRRAAQADVNSGIRDAIEDELDNVSEGLGGDLAKTNKQYSILRTADDEARKIAARDMTKNPGSTQVDAMAAILDPAVYAAKNAIRATNSNRFRTGAGLLLKRQSQNDIYDAMLRRAIGETQE